MLKTNKIKNPSQRYNTIFLVNFHKSLPTLSPFFPFQNGYELLGIGHFFSTDKFREISGTSLSLFIPSCLFS
jgi:hypothetical protein